VPHTPITHTQAPALLYDNSPLTEEGGGGRGGAGGGGGGGARRVEIA